MHIHIIQCIHKSTYKLYCLLSCVVGGEPIPSASSEEESGDRKPGEDEPAAVPGGQQILPARLQEHRWLVKDKTVYTTFLFIINTRLHKNHRIFLCLIAQCVWLDLHAVASWSAPVLK